MNNKKSKILGGFDNRKWLRLLCVSLIFNFQFSTFNSLQAQAGHVTVTGDVGVNDMVARHTEFNNKVKTILGYRVQIASFSGTNAKNSAFNLREQFLSDYPNVQAYIVYDEPNFKVKVGDFRSRLEAYAFLQEIKEVYKGYIIKDNINPEPPEPVEFAPDDEQSGDE